MASMFDFLFQGSPPPSVSASTESQTGFPDWYQELMRANIGLATQTASQPYSTYPGQQVAAPTAPTQQAYQMTQQNVGSQMPALQQASSALGTVAGGFNQSNFNNYLNPYVNGVVGDIATLGARNLHENILPGINDAFTGAGQFGSTRNADFTNRAVRDTNTSIMQQQNSALMQAYQNAMQGYNTGQQNQTVAGQQLGTLGQIYQNTGLKDAAALDTIGQEQQNQTQNNLNVGYQNWQNQQAYPYNNINFLSSIIRGFPAPTTSSATSLYPLNNTMGASPLAQGAAAATAAQANGLGGLAQGSVSATPSFFGG